MTEKIVEAFCSQAWKMSQGHGQEKPKIISTSDKTALTVTIALRRSGKSLMVWSYWTGLTVP